MKSIFSFFFFLYFSSTILSQVLLPVDSAGKWGYIDTKGHKAIPYVFDLAYNFNCNRALVAIKTYDENYEFFYIKPNGKMQASESKKAYTKGSNYQDGVAMVYTNEEVMGAHQTQIIDTNGAVLFFFALQDIRVSKDGYTPYSQFGYWGVLGKNFTPITQAKFTAVKNFSEGLCAYKTGGEEVGLWGYLNTAGQTVIYTKYTDAGDFSENLAYVSMPIEAKIKDKKVTKIKYGYIAGNGDVIIPFIFDRAQSFHEGLALVEKDSFQFFIDMKGNKAVTLDSAAVGNTFYHGIALVNKGGSFYYVDRKGNKLFENYVDASDFSQGYAWYQKADGEFGYMDTEGKVIWRREH